MRMEVLYLNIMFVALALTSIFLFGRDIYKAFDPDKTGTSYFERETKGDNRHYTIRAFDFVWRKKYRQLIAIITAFLSLLITQLDWLFRIGNIEAKDELTALALIITAGIILWSSRETYDLKQNSRRELERLDIAEMNKFLPLIVPMKGVLHANGNIDAQIQNIGKGVAQNVIIRIHTTDIWGPRVVVNEEFANDGRTRFGISEDSVKDHIVNVMRSEKPPYLDMVVTYDDIFGRKLRTVGIKLNLGEGNNYHVNPDKWRFMQDHKLPVLEYIAAKDSEE